MKTFKKLFSLLTPRERKRAIILLLMTILIALLDTISIASILPFLIVLTNPSFIEENFFLNSLFQISTSFGVETNKEFAFLLTLLFFLILLSTIIFKAITNYVQFKFINMREYSIGKRFIEGFLNQPYSWFLSRNSSELSQILFSEIGTVIKGGMFPLMDIISKSILTIALIIMLIVVDPKLTFIVVLFLSLIYFFSYYLLHQYIGYIGEIRLKNNRLRFKSANEAFGAIKDLKLGRLEKVYIQNFSNFAKKFARTNTTAQIIPIITVYIMEIIAVIGVLSILFYKIIQTGSFLNSLPIISLYVFAGYRLMPAIQVIYSGFTKLKFVYPAIDKLYREFKILKPIYSYSQTKNLSFNKTISLKNISYRYPNSSKINLKNISLTIPARSRIGIVGPTGCGKTTVVDIILGLLTPQKGSLEIDGKLITKKNLTSWQNLIGYVQQNIYLSDNTIEANIAFGLDPENIDKDKIIKASKIANLHDFVVSELPKKYKTIIGERGIRLSGGQRQRIGIARALYHEPKVLILDEATSSLDNLTEKVVMDAINNLNKDTTVILIAHRLNTVKNCDIIFNFKNGQLINFGSYNEVFTETKNLKKL